MINIEGDVTVGSAFTDNVDDPINVSFTGGNNQTYTNNGGTNARGIWTINKTAGTTLTAATSLILQTDQPLNITSGTLYLNENSNLTTGAITLLTNGKLVNESATIITLGGNVVNSGTIDLQGGGAGCPENDTILIRSSSAAQRTWNAAAGGRLRLVDVDVQNMSGTGTKTVFSGTNSGGNSANWVFNANCPTALSITPSSASVQTGGTQTFTAAGGSPNYTFSILTNNSGGTINASTGVYTAGTTAGATDTIRVTDAFGGTADAAVTTFGAANKLAFTVQPINTFAGQTIQPPIQVTVQDSFGNTITNSSAAVTIAIQNNPNGGTLAGTLTRNAVNGVATFNDLWINRAASGYTLRATSGSLNNATSDGFDIAAGAAAQFAFVIQPSNANQNQIIVPAVRVAIQDLLGNVVTTANGAVTIALGNNPSGATISGTLTHNAVGGIATFDDLRVNNFGSGYTLTASSGALPQAASQPFNIINPFVVTNTNDAGAGSLRQAIANANNAAGIQTVSFNIAGNAPFVINLTSTFLNVTDSIVLDATTQPGYNGSPVVEIRKGNFPQQTLAGLNLAGAASGSVVKGFLITGFNQSSAEAAVSISSTGNQIQGNIIRNNGTGIRITANNNLIGGTTSSARNVISGNVVGVDIVSSFNQIKGNFIGTNETGTASQANSLGIQTNGSLSGAASNNNVIGGAEAGAKNVISGNSTSGVSIFNNSAAVVQGNFIGTSADGASPIPNGVGILLNGGAVSTTLETKIGGTDNGEGNRIWFNSNAAISLGEGSLPTFTNRIRGNSVFSNGALGIDLTANGVTQNDPRDPDSGVNGRQNFPVLSSATSFAGNTTISGTLNSQPLQTFTLDFYSSQICDASGFGEGEIYLGSAQATTDAGGIVGFTANLPVTTALGRVITATATDANGNTSEFSRCSSPVAAALFSISGSIKDSAGNPITNSYAFVNGSRLAFAYADSSGNYTVPNLPGGGNYTVTPQAPNTTFAPTSLNFSNLSANQTNQNFTGTIARYRIGGQINSTIGGTNFALSGATVTLSGAASATATTDANGNYAFDNLVAGGNYTVSSAKPNFNFLPTSAAFNNLGTNQNVNFNAALTPALTGRIVSTVGQTNTKINVQNADGSAKTTVVDFGTNVICLDPSFSKNGAKIVVACTFINGRTQTHKIYSANFDGSGLVELANVNKQSDSPVFSPNGAKIAFVEGLSLNSGSSIRLMNADGSSLTTIQTVSANIGFGKLSWSADGGKIVFNKKTNAQSGTFNQIFSINADGTNLVQLTTTQNNVLAVFSPDGTKIAFIRKTDNSSLAGGAIYVMNADGSGQTQITPDAIYNSVIWSPDGARLGFRRSVSPTYGVMNADGSNPVAFADGIGSPHWAPTFAPTTSASATPIVTAVGATTIVFPSVAQPGGMTTVVPIPPNSAGTAPNGFVLGNQAYEISTTANYGTPVTVCFNVPANTPQTQFNQLNILHNENGVLVNRTVSRNFSTRSLCASVTSFSPFVIAEEVDQNLPRISGVVTDTNGNVLSGVAVNLTGAETRSAQTDSNGAFRFVNLTANGNYNVSPKQIGYLFNEYNQDFVNLTGEQTVVFEGTAANFQISGQITDAGGNGLSNVSVELGGAAQAIVQTDANGNYLFTNLPADGFYTLTPSNGVNTFTPRTAVVDPLTQDVAGVDFQGLIIAPTAAAVTVGGRVTTVTGRGVAGARVSLTGANGATRTVQTNPFGYYRFANTAAGETYILAVRHKLYRFENNGTLVTAVYEDMEDLNFTVMPLY